MLTRTLFQTDPYPNADSQPGQHKAPAPTATHVLPQRPAGGSFGTGIHPTRSAPLGRRIGASGADALTLLNLVHAQEADALRDSLISGRVPPDFEHKLTRLAQGDLGGHFVAQHSRLLIALLQASWTAQFRQLTDALRARLLRALAYVRKDDDAIPDYQVGGYTDDAQVLRAIAAETAPLIQAYKLWRLRSHVPAVWASQPGPPSALGGW
jgi:hypothetical protein